MEASEYSRPANSVAEVERKLSDIIRADIKPDEILEKYCAWATCYEQDILLSPNDEIGYGFCDKTLAKLPGLGLRKDARILEYGAGTGMIGKKIRKQGYTNIDYIDGSQGMLEVAKTTGIYKKFMLSHLGPEPIDGIDDDTYEAAICIGVCYPGHVGVDFLQEILRIVQPGGFIVIQTEISEGHEDEEDYVERLEASLAAYEKENKLKTLDRSEYTTDNPLHIHYILRLL